MAQKKPAGLLARLNNFSFKMKFLILATSTFVPLVIFMWLNIHQLNEDLQITQLEREGIVYLNPLRKFIDNVQNHRGMSNGYIAGNQSFRPKIDAKEKKTDALILEINKIEQQFGSRFGTSQNWAKLKQDWQSIKQHWAQVKSGTSTLSSKEIFNEHTVLINQLLAFMLQISDASTLTLDAQTDTYYVMDIVFLRTLDVIESMGKIRGLGSGVASRQAITAEERTKLSVLASQLKLSLGNFSHDMEVLEGYPSTYKQVKPNMDALQKSISGLYSLANNSIINADQITLDSKYYFAEATKPIALGYKTFDDLSALLDTLLSQRQAEQQSTLYKIGGLALLSILLVAGMMFSISNSIIGSANRAKKMMNNLANGDFSTKTNKTKYSNDEMGTVMRSADALENTLNALIASMTHVTKQHDAGDIDASIDTNAFKGGYAEMAQGVNTMVAGHIEMNKKILNCIKEFGAGNLDAELEKFPGKKAFANTAIEQVRDNVRALVDDANMLSKSAVEGQLSMRADTKKHQGQFREIIQGVNHTLDAVVGPLNVAANYVENIALGNIPEKITDTYNGDFNEIKNNLNVCIDNINNLISQMSNMTKQHNLGDIEAKVDEDKFHGAFKRMATEVNNMVFDQIAVIEQAMECIDGFGNGDFDTPMTTLPGKKAFINKTIEQVRSNLKALSADTNMLVNAATEGRVKVRVDATQHQGDFRKIVEGVNATLETIVQPIATVKEAVDTINTASGEISMGNNDLSSRTEQQAANLEETSSSMEVLATTVEQNANNAKKANELALEASKVAVKGGEAVEEVVTTMNNINNSSQKIEDIITVIDGIAFQTNILALNAAVEAARAGEQGRGFAVVAGEVRSLAQRSSSAAKEIETLITESVENTNEGTKQVEDAGKTMQEIVHSVERVTQIISDIAAASTEQSEGINQVNTSISNMEQSTQQNAALVEEAAAAAESLLEQANSLSSTVSVFKLDEAATKAHSASSNDTKLRVVG